MRYIMMVLRGKMRRNKGVHISVFVLMLIISLAFCSVLSYYTNSIRHDSKAVDEAGYGDMLAALYGESRLDSYGTSADIITENIGKCDAVQEVKTTDVVYLLLKDCNGKGGNSSSFVLNDTDSILTYDQYDVDNKMTDRRLEKGEVSVPFSFIGMYDCKIGDTVELGNDNGSYTFKVASFFEDPYMGSSVMGIKTILISDEDFADLKAKAAEEQRSGLEDDKRSFELSKLIIIDKKPGLDLTEMEFERELNNVSDFASYCWITLSKEQAGSYMLLMTKVFSAVLLIFVVLLLVAAMIVLGHNIGSSIEMDFVNIGILKAVGMTNASVKLALLAGYMCTVAAGLFAGIPLAIPILKIINSVTRSSSGLEVPSDINVGLVLCVILAILLLVAAFIMLKTRRISEATPIKAIRGGRDSVHFSSVLKLPVSGKKLGVSLAYRQFISEKKQYAAAIIVTAILAMFMILMNDVMSWFNSQNMLVDMFSVTKYDLTASFADEDTQKDIENVISEHTAYRKYQMSSEYLLFDDVQMYCYIVGDPDMINTIRKGRTCTYDNEVLITQYVADGFHINVGDTVTVKRNGVARKMVISGVYDSANDVGKNFAISKAAYSKFASEETVSESGVSGAAKSSSDEEEWSGKGICYDLDNTDECDAIIQEIDKRYGDNQGITYSIHSAKDDFEGVAGTVNIAIQGLTLLTYMLGAVFVIVTVIIVCGKVLMREQKDIGIYKALGFTSFRLRCQLAVRFIVTAVVGSLLGVVLALIVSKPFFKAGFESFGIYSFNLSTSVISLVIPLVFMSVLFSVVAFIRAGNIRKVQPQVLIADQ